MGNKIMNRKLELADIAGYLPYGLRCRVETPKVIHKQNRVINGYVKRGSYNELFLSYTDNHLKGVLNMNLLYCKPILRPMSDLIKPMTHPDINSGEEFVPIVQYLIECGRWNNDIKESISCVKYKYITGSWGINSIHHITCKFENDDTLTLVKIDAISLDIIGGDIFYDKVPFIIWNTFLFKLHFDYKGLIHKGLAVDINTIK